MNDSVFKILTPQTIRAFGIDQRYFFISRKVALDVTPVNIEDLYKSPSPKIVTRQIFLKILVLGKINLLSNNEPDGKSHFFIQKDSSELSELIFRKYIGESNKIITIEKYKNQLSYYMNDCSSFDDRIKNVLYKEKDLTDIVVRYNKCFTPDGNIYKFEPEKQPLKIELLAGFYSARITFEGISSFQKLTSADFRPSNNFTLGVGFILPLQKRLRRHLFVNELAWKTYSFQSTLDLAQTNSLGFDETYHFDYNLNFSYIKLNTLYRYIFLRKNITELYFDVGISNAFAVESECTYSKTEKYLGITRYEEGTFFEDANKHEEYITTGIGISLHNLYGIKFSYERGTGISKYSGLSSSTDTYYIMVNYIF